MIEELLESSSEQSQDENDQACANKMKNGKKEDERLEEEIK